MAPSIGCDNTFANDDTRRVIGVGCRAHCPPEALAAVVDALLARYALGPADVTHIATIAHRQTAPAVRALAARFDRPLLSLDLEALAGVRERVITYSAVVAARLGVANVAESAALAGANSACAVLAGPRLAGPQATAALAIHPPPDGPAHSSE